MDETLVMPFADSRSILQMCAIAFGCFTLTGYTLSRFFRRNDVADVLWGLGFLLMTLLHLSLVSAVSFRSHVSFAMVCLWSLRLSLYLGVRTFTKSEDIRYKTWRDQWGPREPWMAFLKVFLLQGAIMVLVSIPLILIIHGRDRPIGFVDFMALGFFLIGFVVESVADWELRIFKKDPLNKGQTLMGGLWAMCRHPNYLGEILIWWGFGLFSLGSSSGFWGLLSPLLMTFLLLRVSGVPMLENRMRSSSADFIRYIETTPGVFPVKVTHLIVFAAVACSLMALDFLWLGIFLGDFYRTAAKDVARLNGSEWDVLLWPAAGVYFFLALAIQQFAITDKAPQTVYRGFMLGLCIYGVYDLTNLALLRNWPVSMALVDMAWGPILCACGAAVGFWLKRLWLSRA